MLIVTIIGKKNSLIGFESPNNSNDNSCNRYWCTENPNEYRQDHTQRPQKLNVWAGILGSQIIGPFFINGNLNGARYLELLQTEIVPAIRNAAKAQNFDMMDVYFQQDGAPAHFSLTVRNYLNNVFPQRWIGRGGSIHWPARSPDLTPLDFFLWGYLKDHVFKTVPEDLEELRNRILEKCIALNNNLQNVQLAFKDRIFACLEVNGAHFEHLL